MKKSDYAYHPLMSGSDLSYIRRKLNLTVDEFANLLGSSSRMYRYYEDGTAQIPKAMGMVAESMVSDSRGVPQGTLTSYDEHRIKVLSDAMHQYANTVDLDEGTTRRILSQAVREIDLLLSKFE